MAAPPAATSAQVGQHDTMEQWFFRRVRPDIDPTTGARVQLPLGATPNTVRPVMKLAPDNPELRAILQRELRTLAIACGDSMTPRTDTVDIVRVMMAQFVEAVTQSALDHAAAAQHARAFDDSDVIAALRAINPSIAEHVSKAVESRERIQGLLRVDLGGGAESDSYSTGAADRPPAPSTAKEARDRRQAVAERVAFERDVLEGNIRIAQPKPVAPPAEAGNGGAAGPLGAGGSAARAGGLLGQPAAAAAAATAGKPGVPPPGGMAGLQALLALAAGGAGVGAGAGGARPLTQQPQAGAAAAMNPMAAAIAIMLQQHMQAAKK